MLLVLRECAEEGNIRRDPCFIKHEKRAALYVALGLVIDATKYRSSIGDDKFVSLVFWSNRIRWHLAPALSMPRETVEDPTACCWEYDVAKARAPSPPSTPPHPPPRFPCRPPSPPRSSRPSH